jgi:Gly-Xaa carboxypeptidase
MAHTDVVPVEQTTINQWTHPPYSGAFDGTYIWGRGASDCKNQLIGILESITLLLEQQFVPQRTVVLSFGFDEEISGGQGAGSLAPVLIERYGKNGAAVVVDEGNGFSESWGTLFASPGVSE